MDGSYKPYDYLSSSDRIQDILNQPAGTFEEVQGLPDRDRLTFSNGFYGDCSAVYIDIRDSSRLTEKYQRPTLAKIYRSFISEMVAVLNSSRHVREVNIVGDCVWGTYKTTDITHIDDVFAVAYQANTLVKLLNHHYEKKGLDSIKVGIGIDYGRVLMIKAGFSGSGINDVVYMGDVVNRAAHLANEAGRYGRHPIFVGGVFHYNLNDHNQNLLSRQSYSGIGTVYTGNVIATGMDNWVESL